MTVKNKWNNGLYEVQKDNGSSVVLKRHSDGTVFEIAKSEFYFSYKKAIEK